MSLIQLPSEIPQVEFGRVGSYLAPYIFVPKLVSPSIPTHPPKLPHFCYLHLRKEAICSSLEDYNEQIEKLKQEMNDATRGADNIRNDISALAQRYTVIDRDEECGVCRRKILNVGGDYRMTTSYMVVGPMAPFYVFPCGHAFHAQCLIAHVTRCTNHAQICFQGPAISPGCVARSLLYILPTENSPSLSCFHLIASGLVLSPGKSSNLCNVYILLETKLKDNISSLIHSIWNNRWLSELHVEAQGSSGVVYAKCKKIERRELWGELGAMRSLCEGPWVVGGDFNVIRYPAERSNCSRINGTMTEFSECIEELELVDPPLFGGSYTWRRGEGHQTASRIDRFLYSSQWEEQFTFIKQSTMPKLGSDHNPILLTFGNLNFKKSYFKFKNWWMRVEGFKEEVKLWWQSFVITVTPEPKEWGPELQLQGITTITVEEQIELEGPFEEEEILGCLKLCAMEKALGPDGFPMSFYLSFWEILKENIIKAIQEFHARQITEKSFNATFVALIPKKASAAELKDFRPISLITGVYKVIAKLLAERLKRVIDKLVNKNQMAFIKGRQIMDATLIASECGLQIERKHSRGNVQAGH
ncbi:hypothetical protein MTR67_022502 [Solanum verrucosum]|uniref:RING-type domain-containing protein n=1 Tax=Solanum verrucosum TaxID=315347 RepID=A0AAF0QUY8_SOLVR|nr:hypothetical protein MTR67_022502 [Solanum verrucosum]